MRRARRGIAAVAALTLLAAACGDDDAAEEPVDDTVTDAAASDDEMADEEMADDEMADDEMMNSTFLVTLTNTSGDFAVAASGAQAVPDGADEAGPALPGDAYEFVVPRSAGFVSFATMFVQSNDWFWSPGPAGLALTDADGAALSGDVTDQISLWDAGTEADQTPGEGADQAPRQAGPDIGDVDPDTAIRAVVGFDATGYLVVTLSPNDDGTTTVRVENISGSAAVPGPIAPLAWAVHGDTVDFFTAGATASAGLEALAEDGDPSGLADELSAVTGVATPFAPVAWAAHTSMDALFVPGTPSSPGLEVLAEDGGPADLLAEVEGTVAHSGAATNPDGGTEDGPALPGSSYEFEVIGAPGEYLSLASMFVQSNDWFVTLRDLAFYDEDGTAVSGDITGLLGVYDAGTEADQAVGAGPDQAPRQAAPNTGVSDDDNEIRSVDLDLAGYLTLTIEPVG